MPVNIAAGAVLTLESDNANGYDSTNVVGFRGTSNSAFPNDAFAIEAGGTVQVTGPGQKRFGQVASQGKVIIGRGTSAASNSVMKLDSNTYFTDILAADNNVSKFVVNGTADGGLRIESPMNATYTEPARPLCRAT